MSEIRSRVITPQIAGHVLWHFRREGYEPGSFVQTLIELIARADVPNRLALAREYGGYTEAVTLAQQLDDGIDRLREIFQSGLER